MSSIATLVPFLGTLQKFLGITLNEGLPENFLQTSIDDPTFRRELVTWAKARLDPSPAMQSPASVVSMPTLWTSLDGVVEMAREYEGVTGERIDVMLEVARDSGLIEGFAAESPQSPFIAPIIVCNRRTGPATLLYGRQLMQKRFVGKYGEWAEAYARGVSAKRVKFIPGASPFVPDELALRIVDFGANWDKQNGLRPQDVQQTQAAELAGLEVIFAASQHPEWVRQMDGTRVPYAIAAALLLNVPGYDSWSYSPDVWRDGDRAGLFGGRVGCQFTRSALPVLRKYKR